MFCELMASAIAQDKKLGWNYHSADNWKDLIKYLQLNRYDLILADLYLYQKDMFEAVQHLKSAYPSTRILIVSHYRAPEYARKVFQAGADGYILKTRNLKDLAIAVDSVMKGEVYIDEDVSLSGPVREEDTQLEDGLSINQALTPRELEILKLISESKTNKDIGEELFISDQTVSVHRKNLMRKLGVHDTTALIKKALRYKLISIF